MEPFSVGKGGVSLFAIPPPFVSLKKKKEEEKYHKAAEVQRDGADLRFMWVQCSRENQPTGARRVHSPDFCCSSQGQGNSSGGGGSIID